MELAVSIHVCDTGSIVPRSMVSHDSLPDAFSDCGAAEVGEMVLVALGRPLFVAITFGSGESLGKKTEGEKQISSVVAGLASGMGGASLMSKKLLCWLGSFRGCSLSLLDQESKGLASRSSSASVGKGSRVLGWSSLARTTSSNVPKSRVSLARNCVVLWEP